jgi:hypothetical protein
MINRQTILLTGFRDPFLWREGGWFLGVGSGQSNKAAASLVSLKICASGNTCIPLPPDKTEKSANPVDSGEMWEY